MSTDSQVQAHHGGEISHPTPKTYAIIAAILSVVTAIEVWVYYIDALRPLIIPILGVLSTGKFALVVMFYMHLKFDHKVFSRLLILGIILAFGTFLALLALFTFSHPIVIIR